MSTLPKLLIFSGALLIIAGLLWHFGGRALPFGRLPGDIVIEKQNFRLHIPIMTGLVISAIVSFVLYLFRLFR